MSLRIIRPADAMNRLGIRRSKFYADIIGTGRLQLVHLGPRARGVIESELDALIEEMRRARDRKLRPDHRTPTEDITV